MGDFNTQLRAITWDRPESVVQLLDLMHFHFGNEDYRFTSSNKLMKWGEEFASVNLSLDEKLKTLNSFFFEKENFHISPDSNSTLFLEDMFKTKTGHPQLLSIVYQYLLRKLNIHAQPWCETRPYLIRISDENKTLVIDLCQKGQRATGQALTPSPAPQQKTDIVTQFYYLLADLADTHLYTKDYEKTLFLYDCVLSIKPEEIFWYARRGLLKKNLGHFSEALIDLSRYADFANPKDMSPTVVNALVELKGLKFISQEILSVQH